MYCKQCGAENPEGSLFCASCGASFRIESSGMVDYEILYRPSYSLAEVHLKSGQSITAEGGAMVYMSSTLQLVTEAKGGVFGALKRSMLGGESFFMNTYTATGGPGIIGLAPTLSGDVIYRELRSETVFVTSGCYMASDPQLTIDTKFGGTKTFFAREGLFLLKLEGTGYLFMSSYGALHEVNLNTGEHLVVDTGHIVAFDSNVQWDVRRVGGLKSTLFSGEGLVAEFQGPGKIYMQTRSEDSFLSWLIPKLPKNNR
ncbi:MAG: TIGR00266 family protein [Theionarchaea archaeon]|nr:TIGR00266 family protein [Theionarchaea archaeon]